MAYTNNGWMWGIGDLNKRVAELEEGGGSGGTAGVTSINGQDGVVVLTASDVGALPDTYTPPSTTWASLTGIPTALTSAQAAGTASIRAIGATATTAAAGNHTHTGSQIALTGYTIGTVAGAPVAAADSINAAIAKLEKRIADLEAG